MALPATELKPSNNVTSSAVSVEPQVSKTQPPQGAQPLLEEESSRILLRVSPTDIAQAQRDGIITFVQALVQRCFSQWGEVNAYVFGSVALKAYLPDGDIDFSLFQAHGVPLKDTWATRLHASLQRETRKPSSSGYIVTNPQVINAEVKLVKFLVNDVVVDVSYETLGGLCAVNFLQELGMFIGRQDLFKRSVILIKAWCYYESRLLGAHHGLLSSYALEVLVLHICNLYHATAATPLKVLHQFLQVYGSFDWDGMCLTLQGPVPLADIAHSKAPPQPETQDGALLSASYLANLLENVKTEGQEYVPEAFQPKFLNIMDPMCPTNNLGRSVSKANAARIRKAWVHAARALEDIMQQEHAGKALASVQRFFSRVYRCRQVERPLPVPTQLPFLLPPPPHLLSAVPLVGNGQRLGHEAAVDPVRFAVNMQQLQRQAAARHMQHPGRHARQNGGGAHMPGGWQPGMLPPELQWAHAMAAAANGAGPHVRRQPAGEQQQQQQRHVGGREAARQRQQAFAAPRSRHIPGGGVSAHSVGDMRLDMRGVDLRGLADLRTGSAVDMRALDMRNGIPAADAHGKRPAGQAARPATHDMYRSYSADERQFAPGNAALLASLGLQLPNGVHPEGLPLLNGFAGHHAAEMRAQGPGLQGQQHAGGPSVAPPAEQDAAQHGGHTRSASLSDSVRNGARPAKAAIPNVPSLADLVTSGGKAPTAQSASLPVTPIARSGEAAAPPQQPQRPLSEAASMFAGSAVPSSGRAPPVGSVRSHSSGQLGRPAAFARPLALIPPPAGSSPVRRPPPPPPPGQPTHQPQKHNHFLHQPQEQRHHEQLQHPQARLPQLKQQQQQQQREVSLQMQELPASKQVAAEQLFQQQKCSKQQPSAFANGPVAHPATSERATPPSSPGHLLQHDAGRQPKSPAQPPPATASSGPLPLGSPKKMWDDLFPSEAGATREAQRLHPLLPHPPPPQQQPPGSRPHPARRAAAEAPPVLQRFGSSSSSGGEWRTRDDGPRGTSVFGGPSPYSLPLGNIPRSAPASAPSSVVDGVLEGRSPISSPPDSGPFFRPTTMPRRTAQPASLRTPTLGSGLQQAAAGPATGANGESAEQGSKARPLAEGQEPDTQPAAAQQRRASLPDMPAPEPPPAAQLTGTEYPPLPTLRRPASATKLQSQGDAAPQQPAPDASVETAQSARSDTSAPGAAKPLPSYKAAIWSSSRSYTRSSSASDTQPQNSAWRPAAPGAAAGLPQAPPSNASSITAADMPRSNAPNPDVGLTSQVTASERTGLADQMTGEPHPVDRQAAARPGMQGRSMDAGSRQMVLRHTNAAPRGAVTQSAGASPRGRSLPPYPLGQSLPAAVSNAMGVPYGADGSMPSAAASGQHDMLRPQTSSFADLSVVESPSFELTINDFPALGMQHSVRQPRRGRSAVPPPARARSVEDA